MVVDHEPPALPTSDRAISVLMRSATLLLFALSLTFGLPARAGELTIGMTQFPSTLHPLIDSMLAKTYVNAMTRPPITPYDPA